MGSGWDSFFIKEIFTIHHLCGGDASQVGPLIIPNMVENPKTKGWPINIFNSPKIGFCP